MQGRERYTQYIYCTISAQYHKAVGSVSRNLVSQYWYKAVGEYVDYWTRYNDRLNLYPSHV